MSKEFGYPKDILALQHIQPGRIGVPEDMRAHTLPGDTRAAAQAFYELLQRRDGKGSCSIAVEKDALGRVSPPAKLDEVGAEFTPRLTIKGHLPPALAFAQHQHIGFAPY